ncbi:transporter substrate-binding domain-containing protein [Roseibium album]|uniref:ABC transporter arginine-binding protein 1 n=1 Tax=Roseibium album TaxID=311410 RepID=A0A0M6ZDF2_9HYPH|nr:transporter substrate-binding domain-containing protein [Roseibium album]CTQ60805.1 ABC transporter arginine-binding protein 1 precursor [Roseibium album]CTQ64957.1 ABC transporter arginine-binding protein 1 precursor [Roseibium album]CTQ73095.1 ABC transporter arginine-binding protein 1 precursor [Roseibium album]
MKKLVIAAALSAFAVLPAGAETLRIATSADYPPWESVNSSGEMLGFDLDVGNAICARIEMECEWTNQAYDGLLPALVAGQYDLIMSAISITEERKNSIDFSTAYAQAPASFGTLGESFGEISDKSGLQAAIDGKAVGVQGSSIFERVVAEHFPTANVKTYQQADQIIADLKTGRIDAAVMEVSAWDEFGGADKDANLTMFGPLMTYAEYPQLGDGIGLGIGKGNAELKARIDDAIAELLADGTIAKASDKWFGYDVTP